MRPQLTWPGMIGYGTPARRPCQRWTSVPQTSLARVSRIAPPGCGLGAASWRSSTGRPGPTITIARTEPAIARLAAHAHVAGEQRERAERRPSQRAGVDAQRTLQA